MIFSLRQGGAERVLVSLANELTSLGFKVDVLLIGAPQAETPAYPLSPDVELNSIAEPVRSQRQGIHRAMAVFLRLFRLRKALSEGSYDCVFSFTRDVNLLCLIASIGLRFRLVVSERNHPLRFRGTSALRRFLVRVLYPKAHAVVVQTDEIARHYSRCRNVTVIPNPVIRPRRHVTDEAGGEPRIVGAGRLVPQKGFERFLEAAALVRSEGFSNQIFVFGEGPERKNLEVLAFAKGLGKEVFPGQVPDLMGALKPGDVFVLSSRFEGFPNVLMEAMAVGAAPVAFDCLSGPSELIEDGISGFLVREGDVSGMCEKICVLLHDSDKRRKISAEAMRVVDKYSLSAIAVKWLSLVE